MSNPALWWQSMETMETAPRDEEIPLLVWDGNFYHVVTWFGGADSDPNLHWFNGDVFVRPTHWMQLPEPPISVE
jgi:hypothetical protein